MSDSHVPGVYRCAVCGFQLFQSTLRASDGAVFDRDKPGEQCPNDGHLLGRVTWETYAHELADRGAEYLQRAVNAEARVATLEEVLTPFAEAAGFIPAHAGDYDQGQYWLCQTAVKINCGTFRRARAAAQSPSQIPLSETQEP